MRVVVVGPSGSGKTHVAVEISRITGLPYISLDDMNWETESLRAAPEKFRSRVASAIAGDRWVVDGHYPQSRDLVWNRAQTVVWLDFGTATCIFRLLIRRSTVFVNHLEGSRSKKSSGWKRYLPPMVIQRYGRRLLRTIRCRKEQRETFRQLIEYPGLHVERLRSPREVEIWLRNFRERVSA